MQKVISINLNGNAYQLEESGYDTLREYLARAERELAANPDRVEIMADLEQAIADKCQTYLGPHKSVVTAAEVAQIVKDMGPVTAAAGDEPSGGEPSSQRPPKEGAMPKRLYRVLDGAMIAGVCNGIAEYFQVDVTWVRVAFVAAAFITQGVGFIAYIVMMFVVPAATTPEERAAAGGIPFTAQEVVDRVKRQYAQGTREFARHFRRQRREWRREHRQWRQSVLATPIPAAYAPSPLWAPLQPLFGLMHLTLFILMAAMMVSLVNTRAILHWQLPPDVPVWAAMLMLFIAYQVVVSPIRALQHWAWRPVPGMDAGWFAFWHAVVWLTVLAVITWVASNNIPEIREFIRQLPELSRDFGAAVREFFDTLKRQ